MPVCGHEKKINKTNNGGVVMRCRAINVFLYFLLLLSSQAWSEIGLLDGAHDGMTDLEIKMLFNGPLVDRIELSYALYRTGRVDAETVKAYWRRLYGNVPDQAALEAFIAAMSEINDAHLCSWHEDEALDVLTKFEFCS